MDRTKSTTHPSNCHRHKSGESPADQLSTVWWCGLSWVRGKRHSPTEQPTTLSGSQSDRVDLGHVVSHWATWWLHSDTEHETHPPSHPDREEQHWGSEGEDDNLTSPPFHNSRKSPLWLVCHVLGMSPTVVTQDEMFQI